MFIKLSAWSQSFTKQKFHELALAFTYVRLASLVKFIKLGEVGEVGEVSQVGEGGAVWEVGKVSKVMKLSKLKTVGKVFKLVSKLFFLKNFIWWFRLEFRQPCWKFLPRVRISLAEIQKKRVSIFQKKYFLLSQNILLDFSRRMELKQKDFSKMSGIKDTWIRIKSVKVTHLL